jgi:hypothetical protein
MVRIIEAIGLSVSHLLFTPTLLLFRIAAGVSRVPILDTRRMQIHAYSKVGIPSPGRTHAQVLTVGKASWGSLQPLQSSSGDGQRFCKQGSHIHYHKDHLCFVLS